MIHSFGIDYGQFNYRGSPNSTNFGSQGIHVIKGIVLIGDWFFTKACKFGQFDFQSLFCWIISDFSCETTYLLFSSKINCFLSLVFTMTLSTLDKRIFQNKIWSGTSKYWPAL